MDSILSNFLVISKKTDFPSGKICSFPWHPFLRKGIMKSKAAYSFKVLISAIIFIVVAVASTPQFLKDKMKSHPD